MAEDTDRSEDQAPAAAEPETVVQDEPSAQAAESDGVTRREALLNGLVALGVLPGAALFAAYGARYLVPPSTKREQEILLGRIDEFPAGSVRTFDDLFGNRVVVLREGGNDPVAFGVRCSHLGCFAHWEPNLELQGESRQGGFLCPCHNGKFRRDGSVHSGPPPTGLPHFPIAVRDGLVFITMTIYGETEEKV